MSDQGADGPSASTEKRSLNLSWLKTPVVIVAAVISVVTVAICSLLLKRMDSA